MDLPRQRFGANLRRLIGEHELTHEQVGVDALGLVPSTAKMAVSRMCSGRRLPRDEAIVALAEYFEVDLSEFFLPVAQPTADAG